MNNRKQLQLFVGIDPGLDGAIALLDEDGNVLSLQNTPVMEVAKGAGKKRIYVITQMVALLEAHRDTANVVTVGIENVHSMPNQGVTSMFSMGHGFGIWCGIIGALRMPVIHIEPVVWKKMLGIPSGSDKGHSCLIASRIFPQADLLRTERSKKPHDGRADALLIAEAVRRKVMTPEVSQKTRPRK